MALNEKQNFHSNVGEQIPRLPAILQDDNNLQ